MPSRRPVVFLGTPTAAVTVLDAIVAAGHPVPLVVSRADARRGRGSSVSASPVKARALELGLNVTDALDDLRTLDVTPDTVAVVVAYGRIIPVDILSLVPMVNVHFSLLPRWRGAAPVERAILAGDAETGVCIMQMEAGLDTGPVLMREATAIGAEETTSDLHDRLSDMGAKLIVQALARLPLPAVSQPDDGVTYAAKIDKAEAHVDWTRPAAEVDRIIRGLSPFPGAWCDVGGERLKLLRSRLVAGSGTPGQVLHGLTIACSNGAVEVLEAQREGKKPSPAADLLRGFTLPDRLT